MSITLDSYSHRQSAVITLSSAIMWTVELLNAIYKKNLLRLLNHSGLKKGAFANKIGIGPDYFSQLIREKDPVPLGKETMLKICNAFGVDPRYFDQTDNEPQPLTVREERAIYKVREAEKIGAAVAEQLELTIDAVVDAAKKKKSTGTQGKTVRVPRRGSKRG